jgi:GGDEF domain-containing protein
VRDRPHPTDPAGASAERLARAARAAEQLCDTLWEALHEELRNPDDAARVEQLSERLAEVSSTVALLASAAPRVPGPVGPPEEPQPPWSQPGAGSQPGAAPDARAPGGIPGHVQEPGTPVESPRVERRTPPAPSRPAPSGPQAVSPQFGGGSSTRLVDEQGEAAVEPPLAPVAPIQPEIEIRDVRREEGPSAWVSSVGRLLARHGEDGLPFAVLLVEIVDVAHLERSETPHDLHGLVAKVEAALGRGMRSSDHLSRETLGRYWLVAPETNGTGARMLAERLARLVRTSASHRGVPMEVAIGLAVCPDDGTEAPALAARADLGVYSARATGRSIAHTDPPPAS